MGPKDILAVVLVLVAVSAVLWSFLSSKTHGMDGVGFYAPTGTQFVVKAGNRVYTFADGLLLDLNAGNHCKYVAEDQTFTWGASNSDEWARSASFEVVRMLTESGTDLYILTHGEYYATLDVTALDELKWVLGPPTLDVDPQTLPVVFPTVLNVPSYVTANTVDGNTNTYAVRLIGTDPARYALVNFTVGASLKADEKAHSFTDFGLINGLLFPKTTTTWYFVRSGKACLVTEDQSSNMPNPTPITTEGSLPQLSEGDRVFDVYKDDDDPEQYVVGVRDTVTNQTQYYKFNNQLYEAFRAQMYQFTEADLIELELDRTMIANYLESVDYVDNL